MRLHGVGLSVVLNHSESVSEILYLYLKNTEGVLLRSASEESLQLKIQYLQVDQNYPHISQLPVLLTARKWWYLDSGRKVNLVNFVLVRALTKHMNLIKSLLLELDPLAVNVTLGLMKVLTKLTELKGTASEAKSHWYDVEVSPYSPPSVINELVISPIAFNLTLQLDQLDTEQQQGQFLPLNALVSALGVTLANVENAPILLSGIALKDCFDPLPKLQDKLVKHYKSQALGSLYRIVGSLNIIGNPVGLWNNISTGFKELVEKPAEGFKKGPIDLGKGLAEGAGSLISHTVGGAFDSLNKITGSISTGLVFLCDNKEFELERKKAQLKRPTNVVMGLQQGATSVLTGFKEGITGVFLRPYEGARSGGVAGFFTGTIKGVVGLAIMPVTGILDLAAQTTEGIKNTALKDDRSNAFRMRCPRVFYKQSRQALAYNPLDSEIHSLLHIVENGRYSSLGFYQAFLLGKGPSASILVILEGTLLSFSFESKRLEWVIELDSVLRQEIIEGDL
jgi:vacuolar protein sorting-associated protein 13A/C